MYRRKNYKRSARPGYRRCAKMVYSDAAKALTIARGVRRLLNVEVKFHDNQQTAVALTNVPIIRELTNIAQGDTGSTRDGNQCKVIGIELAYIIIANTSTPFTSVRIMIVLDKQTNQAIYVNTDLLDDITATDNILSPRQLNNLDRFSILYDRVHMLSTAFPTVTVKKFIKKEIKLRYDNAAAAITSLTMNSLSFVQMTSEPTNVPAITSFTRIRYVDN